MAAAPKPKQKRRTRAEQRAATLKLILDTSEDLFAQRGYFGVTIKDVADCMGIHPALIHYYFDGKDGKKALFDAVFERRVNYAVETRTAGLDAYEAKVGDHPTVEGHFVPITMEPLTYTSRVTRVGSTSAASSHR